MIKDAVQACDEYLLEKLNQLAEVVADRWPHAVEGARKWGRANRPELTDKCDIEAERHLGELRNNGLIAEFRPACLAFFRAEMELYREHALFLNQEAAA